MSKKRFTDGLESLFGFSEGGELPEESPLLEETEVKVKVVSKPKNKARKRSSKNFTSDLDSLFEDSLQETIEETRTEYRDKESSNKSSKKRKQRRPVSGLDALIRRTLEGSEAEVSYDKRKRVTFVFEKSKVEKLKRIAKAEKIYLKDILGDLVKEYLSQYEKEKGTLN